MQAGSNSSGFSYLNTASIGPPRSQMRQHHTQYNTTNTQHTQFCGSGEHHHFLHLRSYPTDSSALVITTSSIYRAHRRHLAHTGHTQSSDFRGVRVFGGLSYGSMEGAIWTRENVVGKVFPCEDQGGRGITVAVPSGVATWLHCGRSPTGI